MSQIEASITDKQLVDLAYEYLDPAQLQKLEQDVRAELAGLRNVYKIEGNWFTASHTEYSVKGHNPPCGNGKGDLAAEASAGIAVLQLAAGAIDASGGAGVASLIAGIVSYFIGSNNTRQTTGVCIELCTLIPASVDEQWVKEHVSISYYLSDWEGSRQISPGMLAWASLEQDVFVKQVDITHKITEGDDTDTATCKMTAVFARFKNWSHSHNRQVKMDLLLDSFSGVASDCADYSIFNRALYENVIAQKIDKDLRVALINEYAEALRQSA